MAERGCKPAKIIRNKNDKSYCLEDKEEKKGFNEECDWGYGRGL